MPTMGLVQTQAMKQQMRLSPQMLMAASLMYLSSEDLSQRIYKEAEKNPAVEITQHATVEQSSVRLSQYYGNASYSDDYQAFLESVPAREESLQDTLQSQLDLLVLNKNEYRVGYKIIHNLDGRGYNVEDPETLLNADDSLELLKKMLHIVRRFDPPGTACKNVQESLLVQAEIKKEQQINTHGASTIPSLVFTILKDYFLLLGQRSGSICKKLSSKSISCSVEDVENVLGFIRTLNPYPAANYSSPSNVENRFITPEAVIRRRTKQEMKEDNSDAQFAIDFLRGNVPEIEVSSVFKDLATSPRAKNKSEKTNKKFAVDSIKKAMIFIEALEQRRQALHKIVTILVHRQSLYFDKGPGYLQPLRMIDIARECSVDESTVSRISNGKYLLCDWGLIEIKSLFTGAVKTIKPRTDAHDISEVKDSASSAVSRDFVMHHIKLIIEEYEKNTKGKKLSDQKISDMLAEKGIQVARRTVAKYRNNLSIKASYDR
ncbi:MAG TPA: RNA polymerase factor sigma-54 [Treponemataceae bacterium]|nr:RNA polymerase factor sigma-54 [Treponemataceae bacterium]